jgi:hypothetical protein
MQSIQSKILSRIYGHKRGWVFSPRDFLDLGARQAVDLTLSRLTEKGTIRRLSRGLYDYPRVHPKLGLLAPGEDQIARAIVGRDRVKLQPSGAYAANRLGLTEQVPMKVVFLTEGASRKLQVLNREFILKRTTPRQMDAAGKTSGLIIQALRHLGRAQVDAAVISRLKSTIPPEVRRTLGADARLAPSWIGKILLDLAKEA